MEVEVEMVEKGHNEKKENPHVRPTTFTFPCISTKDETIGESVEIYTVCISRM